MIFRIGSIMPSISAAFRIGLTPPIRRAKYLHPVQLNRHPQDDKHQAEKDAENNKVF